MKLIRFVLIHFPQLSEEWKKWSFNIEKVEVATMHTKIENTTTIFSVYGIKQLKYKPKKTGDKFIVVPNNERKEIEEAIIHVNNLISLESNTYGGICSVSPNVAFYPESDEEIEYLRSSKGILKKSRTQIPVRGSLGIDIDFILKYVNDRLDGVALIAESISHNSQSGKYHEYIRFFERAFELSARKLVTPLANFLKDANLGYQKDEIEKWIDVRDPLTHADQRDYFFIHSDVYVYLNRIEQAAYDVLFNKKNWRSDDNERRNVWKPLSGSKGPNSNIFLTKGQAQQLFFEIRDDFGIFPDCLKSMNKLPEGCWSKPGDDI